MQVHPLPPSSLSSIILIIITALSRCCVIALLKIRTETKKCSVVTLEDFANKVGKAIRQFVTEFKNFSVTRSMSRSKTISGGGAATLFMRAPFTGNGRTP